MYNTSKKPGVLLSHEARMRIAADHALLRGLTAALVGAARAALRDEKQRFLIRELLAQLVGEVDRHMAREESELAPLLLQRSTGAKARLSTEHGEQRSVLIALSNDAEDGVCSIDDVLEKIVWFAERFERDMSEEEALFGFGEQAEDRQQPQERD